MDIRIRDFALVVGHAWRCYECREALLAEPDKAWIGYKLTEDERERALKLSDESFATVMTLAEATGLTAREIEHAIDHPRARLRHIGVYKGSYSPARR
jgi:hypothetical protein